MSVLRKNIVALSVLQGANYILPLITLPYLVRVLGPENFGRIAFAQAFIQYFVILTDYGFNLSATRAVALVRDDPEKLSRLFSAVMFVKAALMLFGFMAMLFLIWLVPAFSQNWLLYVLVYLTVVGNVLFPVWLFQGLERMRQITLFTILARTLVVIAIFAFVHQQSDYNLAAALQASGMVIAGLLAIIFIPSVVRLRLHWPGLAQLRHVMVDGWHVFLSTGGSSLFNNSNVFILGVFTGPAIVGQFAAAEKLVKAFVGLNAPITQAAYPYTARLQLISTKKMLIFISKLAKYQVGMMIFSSFVLFVLAEPLTILIFGEEFEPSILFIKILAFLPALTAVSDILGNQIMLNTGLQRQFSKTFIISGLMNLILMITTIPLFGAIGAAFSILFTEILLLILRAVSIQKSKTL
ncbi:MAG: flippase [Acidithiobacillus sp.]